MKTNWKLAWVIVLSLSLGACSGSKRGDDEEAGGDETVAQDAGTDAVPQEQLESLPDPDQAASGDAGLDSLALEDSSKGKDHSSEAPAPDESAPSESVSTPPPSSSHSNYTASGETTDYTVQTGDTLMKIAFENYGDLYQWRKIYDLNRDKIPDINRLSKGTVLKVEKASGVSIDRNGEKYLIKTGDTLGSISDDVYGTKKKWKKLYENNRQMIKDPNRIYAGFYLYYQMSDEDQKDKERFLQQKGSAPIASGGAPAHDAAQSQPAAPAGQPADGGLIDPMSAGQAKGDARAPSSAPAQ